MKIHLAYLMTLLIFVAACTAQQAPEAAPDIVAVEPAEVVPEVAEEALKISVAVSDFPAEAVVGENITISWSVGASKQLSIPHTAIHYSRSTRGGELGTDVTPQQSGYPSLTKEFAKGDFTIPDSFSAQVLAEVTGMLYFRAHAIVEGKQYWTEEKQIPVVPAPEPAKPEPSIQEFVIEADDDGLYPSSIEVKKGDSVKIIFVVRSKNVYFGGLDFRSDYFTTETGFSGSNVTVEFTAEKPFSFTSYWPASNTKKATGNVIVTG